MNLIDVPLKLDSKKLISGTHMHTKGIKGILLMVSPQSQEVQFSTFISESEDSDISFFLEVQIFGRYYSHI